MNVEILHSIKDCSQAEWDSLVDDGRFYKKYEWLLALEAGALIDCPIRYLLVRDEKGKLLAHATVCLVRTSLVLFSTGLLRTIVTGIRHLFPNFLFARLVECSLPVGLGNPICTSPGVELADVIRTIANGIHRIAAEEKLRIMVIRDFSDAELSSTSSLVADGFVLMGNLPTTELKISWASFDQYIASMRSRYREKVKRGLRIAEQSQLTATILSRFDDISQKLAQQMDNVAKEATEYTRENIGAQFYDTVSKENSGRFEVIAISNAEAVVAHGLVMTDGDCLRWIFFGRDTLKRTGAYFLTIASIIRLAISRRIAKVDMGITTYSPKTDFGARVLDLWIYVRCRGRIIGPILPIVARRLNRISSVGHRDVFKVH